MTFEELNHKLGNKLVELGITGFSATQQAVIKQFKKGGNVIYNKPITDDLLTAICFLSFISAPEMFEGSPRVLWIAPKSADLQKRKKLYQQLTMRGDVTIELADDKGKQIEQRNAIFQGTEVLLGNPKRLLELYNQNGFHIGKIHLLIIESFDEICADISAFQAVRRVCESLPKCQKIVFAAKNHIRMESFFEELDEFFNQIEL